MDIDDIVALKDELVDRDGARHRKYDLAMEAIGGNYDSRRMQGFWENWQELTGRPVPSDRENYEFRLNLLPSLISSQRSFIGTIPSLQCPPAALPEPGDKTLKEKAEKLERVYQGYWEYSHVGKRMNQIGYWNPALGATVGVVWPDIDNKRPVWQTRSPYGFYPVLADIDGQDISQAIFFTTYTARQVAAMYPNLRASLSDLQSDEATSVLQYLDANEIKTIVADRYEVKAIDNKSEFVPAVIIPNEAFGEGPWGDSAVEWAIPVMEEHNYRETLKSAILEQTINQPLAVEGGQLAPEEIGMGPRDVVPVEIGGKVYRVAPVQVPYQYLQSQDTLVKMFDRVGGTPDVMRSQFEGSTLTGRGVSTLMGPTQMAFNVKGNEIYPAIATLNEMAMKMWHKMWPRNKHTVYYLGKGNSMTVETFRTGEFDGWYKNIVYVDASSYYDSQSRFVMILQATQNRLMSRQTAMQFVPGVTDAPNEMKLIKEEFEEDMKLQQASQSFGEANVQPDMGAQGATNANLQKGYMGETPPMTPVGGFEAPKPEGLPSENTQPSELLEDMIEFFDHVPVKGKVWLAGGIVTDPSYSPANPNYTGVEVFLEDPNDKAAINTTMRNQFPEVHGHIKYHTGAPSADEPSILVHSPEEEEGEGGELEAMLASPTEGAPSGQEALPAGLQTGQFNPAVPTGA